MSGSAIVAWVGTHRRALLYCGGAVAALVLAAVVVRGCAPPARVEERKETVAAVHEVAATAAEEVRATVRKETRTEKRPGVEIVTVVEERTDAVKREASATDTTATVRTVETRTTTARASWHGSAAALWRPGSLAAAPAVLNGSLARRVLGPAFVGVAVEYDRERPAGRLAVGVVITVEW